VAAKGHLRRMEGELTEVKGQLLTRRKATDDELKYFITSTRFYVYEAKELVKKAERAPLANTAVNANDAASSPHDAAIAVAEAYLTAAFKGDVEAALKLAAPESLAASRRLMEGLKGLGDVESDGKPFRISSVQISAPDAITVNTHVQRIDRTSNTPVTREIVVVLKQANGGWLVTRFVVQAPPTSLNQRGRTSASGGVRPELTIPRGNKQATSRTPKEESTPKETKVIVLKYAKAADLSQTISQLLEINNPDFRVAVDARTNRLLLHGAPDRLKEVIPLIEELDVPSAVKEALPMIEIPKDPDVPGTVPATDPRPAQDSLPSPRSPADTKP